MSLPARTEDLLAHRLTGLFAEKGLKPGDRLPPELELCKILDVSRPALREALAGLEAVGMLATRKGSGRVLLPMDFNTALVGLAGFVPLKDKRLLDLLFIRQLLEVNILPVAAPKISPKALQRLEEVTQQIEEKAQAGEFFADEDYEFHRLLYSGLGNEVMNGVLDLFWSTFSRLDPHRLSHTQRLDETAAHHRRIFDAVKEGDIRKAQYHLDAHFYDTAFAVSHYEEKPSEDQATL
ncbi:FadR family transcriptional regulator [Aureimonas fodinaquatilis]|uniref:FadR family transcriptional regulator n=1 Tax=Aureimonas fodinaquatilis TaxID=2565783 RepID=A0A5B0DTN2_9HYPH|nr:FCD domain-containing protein [Aureimonas fodinaquatilis]KAA0970167.1 FadR family transcriptional regulator [Aureimonas fodinaquatilis]